ncbi:MAG: GNAT family N-acetyltransferase [Christensenella sp.]|nr:GNAT family N-acetyltransferase [Christensenella sp.]
MKKNSPIRFAMPADADALLNIYAQYIDTPITFECTLPSQTEFAERISAIGEFYPYLVWEEKGQVVGDAYAHRQKEREAYQWNAELSVYLDQTMTSQSIGKKLYLVLMELLRRQGIKNVYGGVTLPNAKSEGLHRSLGFRRLGTYHNTGYKSGLWHDVCWFEKKLSPYIQNPAQVCSIHEIPSEILETVINRYCFETENSVSLQKGFSLQPELLHTTKAGSRRIAQNLGLTDTEDIVAWCRQKIVQSGNNIIRKGKNWYVDAADCIITINAASHTVITAHPHKQSKNNG